MTSLKRILTTFGNADFGRLGLGWPLRGSLFPRLVDDLLELRVKQVACGGAHTVVLLDDGSVFTCGLNKAGQLGHSNGQEFVPVPLEAIIPENIKLVAAGEEHTLCVGESGAVWAFGWNGGGQLGLGLEVGPTNHTPRMLKALSGVKVQQVAAGVQHSLALSEEGEVFAWGASSQGALGVGPGLTQVEYLPRVVSRLGGKRIASIAAGHYHSGAVDADGYAHTWGHGIWWQLAHGPPRHMPVPMQVPGLSNVSSLALGCYHSLALRRDGSVLAWGTDENGCLGQGWRWPTPPTKAPKPVNGSLNMVQVSCGWKHCAGVSWSGQLLTWGWGGSQGAGGFIDRNADMGAGQLGTGDIVDHFDPVQVQRLMLDPTSHVDLRQGVVRGAGPGLPFRVVQVACGRNHTAAIIDIDEHLLRNRARPS